MIQAKIRGGRPGGRSENYWVGGVGFVKEYCIDLHAVLSLFGQVRDCGSKRAKNI